jgi:hypothetical protein
MRVILPRIASVLMGAENVQAPADHIPTGANEIAVETTGTLALVN